MSSTRARIWLLVGGLVVASCSFDSSSPGRGGRDSGPGAIDAAVDPIRDAGPRDAAAEPDAGVSEVDCATACEGIGTCEGEVCAITCGDDDCDARVDCPAGVECRVRCTEEGACAGGVRCGRATSCTVECSAKDTCGGVIECGKDRPCTVTCSAQNACTAGVSCGDSCACSVECTGPSSCDTGATCPDGCDDGKGCTVLGDSCDTCDLQARARPARAD